MKVNRGRDAGFTLIELLVVLAIISLSAIAVMQSMNFHRHGPTVSEVSKTIAIQAREASLRAISRSTTVTLIIDVKSHVVSIRDDKNPIRVPQDYLLSVTSGAELKPENNKAAIEFYPDGTSSGGHIEISDFQGHTALVGINWLTGTITDDHQK